MFRLMQEMHSESARGQQEVQAETLSVLRGMTARLEPVEGIGAILGGHSGLDMGGGTKLQGAREAAAMMYLEQEFIDRSRQVWQAIEKNWTHVLGGMSRGSRTPGGWRRSSSGSRGRPTARSFGALTS